MSTFISKNKEFIEYLKLNKTKQNIKTFLKLNYDIGGVWEVDGVYVFSSNTGGGHVPNYVYKSLKSFCKAKNYTYGHSF